MEPILKWISPIVLGASIVAAASVGQFKIGVNAQSIEDTEEQINLLRATDRELTRSINSLERGDDALTSSIILNTTKLENKIETLAREQEKAQAEQSMILKSILEAVKP